MCTPAVVGHSIDFEAQFKKPAIPVILSEFYEQVKENARSKGMPGLRVQYIKGPVWGKTREELQQDVINGKNPVNGKLVMQELIENLLKPLTGEEKETGKISIEKGPETFTDSPDNLQKMFLENKWTDNLPVILPTEDKVNEMLKGTSHEPDKIVGRMAPTAGVFRPWSYTVKTVAINAVMAGAKPEYMPVILAIVSAGQEAISVSDNSFVSGAVINGPIRDEIGLNYDIGVMGPFAHANTTIGRAWNLVSINGGDCGKAGTTYMGQVGNPMSAINIIIAENEEKSPWKPLSVRKGFKKNENVVTLLTGWGVLSAKNWKATNWTPNIKYPKIIKDIYDQQAPFLFGTCAVLSPPIADFCKRDGYDTVDELEKYVTGRSGSSGPGSGFGGYNFGSNFVVIVAGGSNNNYFSMGGLQTGMSVRIDKWR